MTATLADIDLVLTRIERLAKELRADPAGRVRRSARELRSVFAHRQAMEPAVARVRDCVAVLRRENHGTRREFQRRAVGVDHLEQVVENELLPNLRRIGFDV